MATHLIQIQSQEHLDAVRAAHADLVLFFDNPLDSACCKLRAPLLSKCAASDRLLVAVSSPTPITVGTGRLPFVTVVKEAELAASLYTEDVEELWKQIESVYNTN